MFQSDNKKNSLGTILAPEIDIKGDINVSGNIIVYGKVTGNIISNGYLQSPPPSLISKYNALIIFLTWLSYFVKFFVFDKPIYILIGFSKIVKLICKIWCVCFNTLVLIFDGKKNDCCKMSRLISIVYSRFDNNLDTISLLSYILSAYL